MKSIICWLGGKYYLAKKIISLFPPHQTYVEPFGGAGWVLFKKEPSEIEVYNDINPKLFALFYTIKNKEMFELFKEQIELTIYSRELFNFYSKQEPETLLQKAITVFCLVRQSYGGNQTPWGYGVINRNRANPYFKAIYKDLHQANKRLSNVIIENLDFRKVFEKYDSPNTLFYADPPYVPETRKNFPNAQYEYEMSQHDHEELVDILLNTKGKVILSGYKNKIYEKLEKNGWLRIDFETNCWVKGKAKTLKDKSVEKRIDSIWLNFKTSFFGEFMRLNTETN